MALMPLIVSQSVQLAKEGIWVPSPRLAFGSVGSSGIGEGIGGFGRVQVRWLIWSCVALGCKDTTHCDIAFRLA